MQDNVILSSVEIADRVKKIQIQAQNIARKQKPGQFVIVRVSDSGERIPLTIVDADKGKWLDHPGGAGCGQKFTFDLHIGTWHENPRPSRPAGEILLTHKNMDVHWWLVVA